MRTISKILLPIIFLPVLIFATIQFSGVYQVYTVMSNSTAPSYETGDIVILDKTLPFSQYKVGDAVLYEPPTFGEIVIHRIYDIKFWNNTYYFAIKGDSNPQPDTISQQGNDSNQLLVNRTVTWSAFYGSNATNPTAPYIIATYYPANDVVLGKVIYRIPMLGWFFVPFNSPLPEPFHVLPISMFSAFTLYYIILAVACFFILMKNANNELKKLINTLSSVPGLYIAPSHIKIRRFYSLVGYPLIIFIFIFFTATPTPLVDTTQVALQSVTQNNQGKIPYTTLVYLETDTLTAFSINQNNKTTITLNIYNQSNRMFVNITKDFHGTGQDLTNAEPYNIITNTSYSLTVDLKSMFVNTSTNPNAPEWGKFFDYAIPVQKHTPVGLMTQNVYLEAENSTYNNIPSYATHLNFSFIQDLISYQWNVKAYFSRSAGYLEYMQVVITQQLWGIPEYSGMIIISLGSILIYNLLRSQFQKMYDERYINLTGSRGMPSRPQGALNLNPPVTVFDRPIDFSERNTNQTDNQNNYEKENEDKTDDKDSKKKLSWEEYKKLEDGE